MKKPPPIKLPYELEKEEEAIRLHTIEERIRNDRKNGRLLSNMIVFLEKFEVKIAEFNQYIELYTPYPNISQIIKDHIRNKFCILKEYYYSYTGYNPYPIICECFKKKDADLQKLNIIYKRISNELAILNSNADCIHNKQIIFVKERTQMEEYDWT